MLIRKLLGILNRIFDQIGFYFLPIPPLSIPVRGIYKLHGEEGQTCLYMFWVYFVEKFSAIQECFRSRTKEFRKNRHYLKKIRSWRKFFYAFFVKGDKFIIPLNTILIHGSTKHSKIQPLKMEKRHLDGKGEYIYDFKYDILTVKMKGRACQKRRGTTSQYVRNTMYS